MRKTKAMAAAALSLSLLAMPNTLVLAQENTEVQDDIKTENPVGSGKAVIQSGDERKEFSTLTEALSEAKDGDVITLSGTHYAAIDQAQVINKSITIQAGSAGALIKQKNCFVIEDGARVTFGSEDDEHLLVMTSYGLNEGTETLQRGIWVSDGGLLFNPGVSIGTMEEPVPGGNVILGGEGCEAWMMGGSIYASSYDDQNLVMTPSLVINQEAVLHTIDGGTFYGYCPVLNQGTIETIKDGLFVSNGSYALQNFGTIQAISGGYFTGGISGAANEYGAGICNEGIINLLQAKRISGGYGILNSGWIEEISSGEIEGVSAQAIYQKASELADQKTGISQLKGEETVLKTTQMMSDPIKSETSSVRASAGWSMVSNEDGSWSFKALGEGDVVDIHRLYNPADGAHFFTGSQNEVNALVQAGWKDEGVAWTAPGLSDIPVFRLYNPNGSEHHFTASLKEKALLIDFGWIDEGIAWYSDPDQGVPVYRQYDVKNSTPTHMYTASLKEDSLLSVAGWRREGIGWYGVKQ